MLEIFSPYGRSAGSVRTRVHEWVETEGLSVTIHQFLGRNTAGVSAIAADPIGTLRAQRSLWQRARRGEEHVVLIHREASPLSDGRLEARLMSQASRSVVDLDDGLQWDWGRGGFVRGLLPKASKTVQMVRAADVVIAGNDLIAEWAAPIAQCVVVIPTCVNPDNYAAKSDYEITGPPVLGWIGSAATEMQLASIGDLLLRLHERRGARLQIVGDGTPKLGPLEAIIDRVAWSEEDAYRRPATWDLGLMPVPDGLVERSKCGYKALQYAAAGLPIACSPVGVNAEILGFGGVSMEEQIDQVLDATASERRAFGVALRTKVEHTYSYGANRRRWLDAVFGLASSGPTS